MITSMKLGEKYRVTGPIISDLTIGKVYKCVRMCDCSINPPHGFVISDHGREVIITPSMDFAKLEKVDIQTEFDF